jgi:hypothetical protein
MILKPYSNVMLLFAAKLKLSPISAPPECRYAAPNAESLPPPRIRNLKFFHPGSRVKKILDPRSPIRIRIIEFKYLKSKNVSKLSDICSRAFIPDPDPNLDFLPIPDPGSRGQKGTGSATLRPHQCCTRRSYIFKVIFCRNKKIIKRVNIFRTM